MEDIVHDLNIVAREGARVHRTLSQQPEDRDYMLECLCQRFAS